MFCQNCGSNIKDGLTVCPRCGQPITQQEPVSTTPPPPPQGKVIDNGLIWAILTTLFCCLPLGIVAIIKSCQVDTFLQRGEIEKAKAAASSSKKWSLAAFITLIVIVVLYVAGMLLLGAYASMTPGVSSSPIPN